MNNKITALIGASLALLTAASCSKDDDTPQGGKGGNAALRVNTFHHTRRIDSMTVYIKYNTKDLPANGIYDDSARVVKSATDTVAVFSGLKTGDYYLYGNGWDPIINQGVHGGSYFPVTSETSQTINLAVSEE